MSLPFSISCASIHQVHRTCHVDVVARCHHTFVDRVRPLVVVNVADHYDCHASAVKRFFQSVTHERRKLVALDIKQVVGTTVTVQRTMQQSHFERVLVFSSEDGL